MDQRPRHPKKDVEAVIAEVMATDLFRLSKNTGRGHRWATLLCRIGHREHTIAVWSTPKSPSNHAKQIRRAARRIVAAHEEEQR